MVKTLLERAKPQLLEALDKRQDTLKGTIDDYRRQLSNGHYVYKAEYAMALDLIRWVEDDTNEKVNFLWDLFEKPE